MTNVIDEDLFPTSARWTAVATASETAAETAAWWTAFVASAGWCRASESRLGLAILRKALQLVISTTNLLCSGYSVGA